MNQNLKVLINKHPTLTHKEVFYQNRRLILFYDVQKDDAGHEYFDDFFVTNLVGEQQDDFTDQQYGELKRFV